MREYLALPVKRIYRVLSPRQSQLISQRTYYWTELSVRNEKARRNSVKSVATIRGDRVDKSLTDKYNKRIIDTSFIFCDTLHYDESVDSLKKYIISIKLQIFLQFKLNTLLKRLFKWLIIKIID